MATDSLDALDGLASLTTPLEREAYFASRPEIATPETVWDLCGRSGEHLRTDLEAARRLAETAGWLAGSLGDTEAQARAHRAEANVHYYDRGYAEARDLYDRSVDLFLQAGNRHEAAISQYSAMGPASQLGDNERALELAHAAREVFVEVGDQARLARVEINLGFALSRWDRFEEALQHHERALELLESSAGRPSDIAITLRNIAVCHQDLNDFRTAERAYDRAREYCREQALVLIGLEVEYNIAYLFYMRGEYARAIHLFEMARRSCEDHDDSHHMALCDLDLAEIFLELNLVKDAAHLAERAFSGFSGLEMEYESAKSLAYQALAARRRGDADRALELLDDAHDRFRSQDNSSWVAMTQLYRAVVLHGAGRLDRAALLAQLAHESFIESAVPSRIVACEVLLARLELDRGRTDEARKWCRAAADRLETVGRPSQAFEVHLVAGRIAEAENDLGRARAEYELSQEAIEGMRGQLGSDELKIAFAGDKQETYEALVELMLASGEPAERAAAAFECVERAKSRGLADLLAFGRRSGGTGDSSDPRSDEIQLLRERLNWQYRQIDAEELKGPERSTETLVSLRDECRELEEILLRRIRRQQAADPSLGVREGAVVADLSKARSALREGALLIEYFIARGSLYAFVLDSERLEAVFLGKAGEVEALHRFLEFQLSKLKFGLQQDNQRLEQSRKHTLGILQNLFDALLAPLRLGPEISHLVVVPHGFLHHLPFHALHDRESFLIDRFPISYAPSATVLHLGALRTPEFEERSLVVAVADERAPRILDEANAVASVLPNCRLLLGEEATSERLERLGAACRFVHIATHGLYRKDNPMFSALQLGGSRLSLLDLYDIELQAELAVVSGCGTGLSTVQGTDELVGLTRGLLFAGARSVLATLWDVNDESTAQFMQSFYEQLARGAPAATALQGAIRALRARYPHPYFWAPFTLTGQPS